MVSGSNNKICLTKNADGIVMDYLFEASSRSLEVDFHSAWKMTNILSQINAM